MTVTDTVMISGGTYFTNVNVITREEDFDPALTKPRVSMRRDGAKVNETDLHNFVTVAPTSEPGPHHIDISSEANPALKTCDITIEIPAGWNLMVGETADCIVKKLDINGSFKKLEVNALDTHVTIGTRGKDDSATFTEGYVRQKTELWTALLRLTH